MARPKLISKLIKIISSFIPHLIPPRETIALVFSFITSLIIALLILTTGIWSSKILSSHFNLPVTPVTPPIIAGIFAIIVALLQLRPNTRVKEQELMLKKAEIELLANEKQNEINKRWEEKEQKEFQNRFDLLKKKEIFLFK